MGGWRVLVNGQPGQGGRAANLGSCAREKIDANENVELVTGASTI